MPHWRSAPHVVPDVTSLGQYRWDPIPVPEEPLTFLTGMRTVTTAGDVHTQVGMAAHVYLATASMEGEAFYSADSEMLVVPQEGRLRFVTELGAIELGPQQVALMPRGLVFRADVIEGPARGFVCENYGLKFDLAASRVPSGPTAWPTRATSSRRWPPSRTVRHRPAWWSSGAGASTPPRSRHSPFDVVAWHGNYAPWSYDLHDLQPGGRGAVRPPRPLDLHGADGALGRGGDRQHRLRAVPRPLGRGRGHLPPALVPQERHERADGQHPRGLRRQAAGLRAGRGSACTT